MIIAHNMLAMNTQRRLNISTNLKGKSSERLSSGFRINRSADDAAGLSISEKMRAQIRGLDQGADNIQDGISLIKTADGALNEVHAILQRMNELAVQAANDTNTATDRDAMQAEVDQLAAEITHIGKTTTFNTLQIFDDAFKSNSNSITSLVSCPSADIGYLSEAITDGTYWYSAATIDFSSIDSSTIAKLDGKGFSFNCSQFCDEVFDFKFVTDGTPSSASNLNGRVTHKYIIDISNCTNGSDIVNAIYDFVSQNLPVSNPSGTMYNLPGSLMVSHSNDMMKSADGNSLIIYANGSRYSSENSAKNAYPNYDPISGAIDCSSLVSVMDIPVNLFNIQNGPNSHDSLQIPISRMNAVYLNVSTLSLRSHVAAGRAITAVQEALEIVSSQRGTLGAYQNRLEHIYNYNLNTSENTQAAESRIRDTDMADEMIQYSLQSVLQQAGQAMLAQANSLSQNVLSLLK